MPVIDSKHFRNSLGHFASGITVLTTRDAERDDWGMTASSFCTLSLQPPLVLICVAREAGLHDPLLAAPGFAINVLAADQAALSDRFAGGTRDKDGRWMPWPDDRDRFADLATTRATHSEALLLDDALLSLDCVLHGTADGGDHTIVIGRVVGIRPVPSDDGRGPLLYHRGRYRLLGD